MLDNATLHKKKTMREHLEAKHIHSKRIRLCEMQFVNEEKEK